MPDPGLLAVALAQGIGLLDEREGELCIGGFPETWERGLPAALAELWGALLRVTAWNPVEGWSPGAAPGHPFPSLYLVALLLLGRLPDDGWARPAELEAWLLKHHPFWAGGPKRGESRGAGLQSFLLGLAYPLRLLQAMRDDKDTWLVRLSSLGKWMFGLGPEPQLPAFPQTLLAQPNLEILVYRQGLSPALVARLGRFAAWKGLGAALTMQLQPESVYLGLEAGETFETMRQTLERHGMKPTPDTVYNALRTWADKRDRIQVYAGGALFEFLSEADLNEALARGLPAVPLGERLAIVAAERDIDYRHFRLTATRDYGLPPEKCVDVEEDGVTLSIDLAKSDLLIETEVRRFAEPLDRKEPGRRFFHLTPASLAAARDSGLTLTGLETWFPQRCGEPMPPAARLLFAGPEVAPARLRKLLILEVAEEKLADGLEQWPGTRSLIEARLGPTALVVPEEHVAALRARLEQLGMRSDPEA